MCYRLWHRFINKKKTLFFLIPKIIDCGKCSQITGEKYCLYFKIYKFNIKIQNRLTAVAGAPTRFIRFKV